MSDSSRPCCLSDLLFKLKNRHDQGIHFFPLRGDREFLSYAGLYHQARYYLGALQAHGLEPGDKVVFQLRDEFHFLVLYWACILGGMTPVPVALGSGESHRNKLVRITRQLERPFFVTHVEELDALHLFFQERLQDQDVPRRCLLAVEELASVQINGRFHVGEPGDVAFIQYSSGSTGDPKGVVLTHRNILCNLSAMLDGSGLGPKDKTLSWMPLTHDMGLIGFHLTPLAVGIDHGIMSPGRFLLNPMSWIKKAAIHKVTVLGSPNFGYRHFLDAYDKPANRKKACDWDLSHVRLIFNGAEPISAPLCRRFHEALANLGLRDTVMFPVYGMAEATLAVTFPPAGEPITTRLPGGQGAGEGYVDLGFPVRDCAVRIWDAQDKPVPEEVVGHILIKGGNVTPGYYARGGLNRDRFTADGWLRTGDLGFFSGRRLVVTGRQKDVIFRHGQNFYAHDLEEIAAGHERIGEGQVAFCGVPDPGGRELIVAFVRDRGKPDAFAQLTAQLRHHMGRQIGLEPDEVVPVRKLPRTTSGKLMRFQLADAFRAGEYESVLAELRPLIRRAEQSRGITLPQTPLETELADLWKDVLGRLKVGRDEHFLELGGDSVKACALAVKVRKRFKVRFPLEEIFLHPTLHQMAAYIETAPARDYHEIEPTQPRATFPPSAEQERILFLERMENMGLGYHIYEVIETPLPLDIPWLERALNQLVAQHEILRCAFRFEDGRATAVVLPELRLAIHTIRVAERDWEERFRELSTPFDLARPPLLRVTVAQTDSHRTLIFFDVHHIICDGTSLGILIEELFVIYKGHDLNPPDLQYRDYALWQQAYLATEYIRNKERFWMELLADQPTKIELPTDPGKRGGEWTADRVLIGMDEALTSQLRRLAVSAETTLAMVLLTAFKCLLAKYTGMEDILLGAVTAGRNHHGLEDLPGMFVKTVVLRGRIDAGSGFQTLLTRVRDHFFHVYENQDYPFDKVVSSAVTNRQFGANPLFDICFVLQNFTRPQIELDGFELIERPFHPSDTKFDLSLSVHERDDGLLCEFEFRRRRFTRKRIERMANHYRRILDHVVRRGDITRAEIQILSEAEQSRLLTIFNHGQGRPVRLLVSYLEAWAAREPDRVCCLFEDQSWTYGEYARRVKALAQCLAAQGVRHGWVVGLMLEPSDHVPALMLALWKLGAAWLYLSPDLPNMRRIQYLDTAEARLLLHAQPQDPPDWSGPVLTLGSLETIEPQSLPEVVVDPNDVAAVIFTSGSTGTPKAVLVRQSGVFHALDAVLQHHHMQADDIQLALSAYSFDPSIVQTFLPLMVGAAVCVASADERRDPRLTVTVIEKRGVTHLGMASSQLEHLCEARAHFGTPDPGVRFMMIGGEAFRPEAVFMAKRWFPAATIINYYGPTEATVAVTCDVLTQPLDPSIIGRPFDHARIYIVGVDGQVQPIGYPGELCIAGDSLAAGYRPAQFNEDRFIADPFYAGETMYRSGDAACWLPDGRIRFLGRLDHQEKIRGFRIEPGEIEAVIAAFPGVRNALAAGVDSETGGRRLCAWFSADDTIDLKKLQGFIAERLPDYMVPSRLIRLDELPLNHHGKIDRARLPQPAADHVIRRSIIAPRNELEKLLVSVWAEALDLPQIGVEDNFFDLGGHSLTANRLMARIETRLEIEASVRLLFQNPTIAQLAPILQNLLDQRPRQEQSPDDWFDRMGVAVKTAAPLLDGFRHTVWCTDAAPERLRALFDAAPDPAMLPRYLLPADAPENNLVAQLDLDSNPDEAVFEAAVLARLGQFQRALNQEPGRVVRRYAAGHHPGWFVDRNLRSVLLGEFHGVRGLDPARVHERIAQFIERQDLLRAHLVHDGEHYQLVEFQRGRPPEPPLFDLSHISPGLHDSLIERIAAGLRKTLLAEPPLNHFLFSLALVRCNVSEYRVLVAFDHIIADYGAPPIALEWLEELNRPVDVPPPEPVQVTPFHQFAARVDIRPDDPRIAQHAQHKNIQDFVAQVLPLHQKYGMGKAIVHSAPWHFEGEPHSGDDFMAFGLFMAAAVLGLHFDLDEVPLRVLTSRRRFGDLNLYHTVGDFHDSVPVLLPAVDPDPATCAQKLRDVEDKYNREGLYLSNMGSVKALYHGIFKSPFNFNYVGLIRRRDVEETLATATVFSFVSYPIYAYREGARLGMVFFHGLDSRHLETLNTLIVRYFNNPTLRRLDANASAGGNP